MLELANGPLTAEADAILARKGVIVLPDMPAPANGIVLSSGNRRIGPSRPANSRYSGMSCSASSIASITFGCWPIAR